MKYKKNQIIKHKYNVASYNYFGYGFISSINKNEVIICFSKDKKRNERIYQTKYLYHYEVISEIFNEI